MSVISPRPGDVYVIEPGYSRATQSIELAAQARRRVPAVDWYVDGRLFTRAQWPYDATWLLEKGTHVAIAVSGGSKSRPVRFEVR
ncbi:MAG TPA: hypothetical protein VL354_06590 [Spirochaetia bacterium]|nr:hypothetical protein [Spirochaetia bacterium]